MMLSQTAEHALRAVLFLAGQPEGERVSAERIAEAIEAPRNYLGKTLAVLARAGMVTSARGPRGGFRLEVSASDLTLARVIGAFDESASRGVCLMGGRRCGEVAPCHAHESWKEVRTRSRAPLEATTIADLLGGKNH